VADAGSTRQRRRRALERGVLSAECWAVACCGVLWRAVVCCGLLWSAVVCCVCIGVAVPVCVCRVCCMALIAMLWAVLMAQLVETLFARIRRAHGSKHARDAHLLTLLLASKRRPEVRVRSWSCCFRCCASHSCSPAARLVCVRWWVFGCALSAQLFAGPQVRDALLRPLDPSLGRGAWSSRNRELQEVCANLLMNAFKVGATCCLRCARWCVCVCACM